MVDYQPPPKKRNYTLDRALHHSVRLGKHLYQRVRFSSAEPSTVLFVVGCQRSGTNMLINILDRDVQARTYPEVSKLTAPESERGLRLRPLDEVRAELDKEAAPLLVVKPLVESQNVLRYLEYFEPSKAIWIYRNYRSVAASHVKKWTGDNSIRDLYHIVEQRSDDWRTEKVSDEVRDIVTHHFSPDMDGYDAAALYWWVRNSHYFNLDLNAQTDVMLCKYEALVAQPSDIMHSVYEFLGLTYPGDQIVSIVHTNVVNRGRTIDLSPEIQALCEDTQTRLDKAWDVQRQ